MARGEHPPHRVHAPLNRNARTSERSSSLKRPEKHPSRWLAAAATVVFLVYALSFLYFFVDDEGIPYVYAQNILHGKGLAYNSIEGRVEGYSDFLHVWTCTAILGAVRAAGLPKFTVFF